MKTFTVTRTTVETFTIEASDKRQATSLSHSAVATAQPDYVHSAMNEVAEKLAEPEYRIRILPDDLEYEHGDYPEFDEETGEYMPDGAYTAESQEAGEARVNADIEREGLWGYVVECRTEVDGEWEPQDSCWGFIGQDIQTNGMADYIGDVAVAKIVYE